MRMAGFFAIFPLAIRRLTQIICGGHFWLPFARWQRSAMGVVPVGTLPARQPTLVCPNPFFEDASDFFSDNLIFLAGRNGKGGDGLRFPDRCHLFGYHAVRFILTCGATCCESHYAQSNDALCIETELHGFKR